MAYNAESTKKKIISYLNKNSLKYKYDEEVNGFLLGFSIKEQQDMRFKQVISIQEGGDFIQFFSVLKLNPICNDIQETLLKENLTKKLIKWTILQEEKSAICFVDIFIDEEEEISHRKIERALAAIQESIASLKNKFLSE